MRIFFITIFLAPIFLVLLATLLFRMYKIDDTLEYLDHEPSTFEVVIARYNEDLSWIDKEFPYEKVTVYNKGKDDLKLPANCSVIKLPNIGRESHTYLYHIIENYNQLPDRILFLQGDPFTQKRHIFQPLNQYKIIYKARCNNIIAANCFLSSTTYENTHIDFFWTKWSNTIFKSYDFTEFKKEFIDDDMQPHNYFKRNVEANFAVDKEKILGRKLAYYKKIFASLDNIAPVEGHYLERLWDEVFREN